MNRCLGVGELDERGTGYKETGRELNRSRISKIFRIFRIGVSVLAQVPRRWIGYGILSISANLLANN